MSQDISAEVFVALQQRFFDDQGRPVPFMLPKRISPQDDPLDLVVHRLLSAELQDLRVLRAPGPLVSPDLVISRRGEAPELLVGGEVDSTERILGLEVKKLQRTKSGGVARASGLDYNSTPPCDRIIVWAASGQEVIIPGMYLFVCAEPVDQSSMARVTAMALCDGALLNTDFEYYRSVVGEREKTVGVGSYGDGADRNRPMVIFANPLGFPLLDYAATLVHKSKDLESANPQLRLVGEIIRSSPSGARKFYCYRHQELATTEVFHAVDPFPAPSRSVKTVKRGSFVVHPDPAP